MAVRLRGWRVLGKNVKRRQFSMLHGLKHGCEVQAALVWNLHSPGALEVCAQLVVFYVLKPGKTVWDGAHIAAALDIILSAQWIHTAAVAAHVSGEQRQVDQREHVVHGVVAFSEAKGPADLRALRFSILMCRLADHVRRNASVALGALQSVFFYMCFVSFKTAGLACDKFFVRQSRGRDFARNAIRQRDVR